MGRIPTLLHSKMYYFKIIYMDNIKFVYTCIVLLTLLLYSCDNNSKTINETPDTISFTISKSSDIDIFNKYVKSVNYTLLKESPDFNISQINKLIHFGNRFYVLEKLGNNRVCVFNQYGNFLHTIGQRGNGPGEYIRIWDIDVDSNFVYLFNNSGNNIILKYTYDGTFTGNTINLNKLKGVKGIKVLNDTTIAASHRGCVSDTQYSIINDNGDIIQNGKPFQVKYEGDKGNNYDLRMCNNLILIHQPLTGSITGIDNEGNVAKEFSFEFSNRQIPINKYKSYVDFLENKGDINYAYFSDTPIIIDNLIIGSVMDQKHPSTIIGDITSGEVKTIDVLSGNINEKVIFNPLVNDGNNIYSIISLDNYESIMNEEWVPDSVRQHLNEGNKVIIQYQLK